MTPRLSIALLGALAPSVSAQTAADAHASPFPRLAAGDTADVATIGFDASAHGLLRPAFDRGEPLRLEGFALPGGEVDLVLRPVRVMPAGAAAVVVREDGTERLAPSVAMFQGHVEGRDSSVYLSVSPTQLHGYVAIEGELLFVSSGRNEAPGLAWVARGSALPSGGASDAWCNAIGGALGGGAPSTPQLGNPGPDVHVGEFFIELDEQFGDLFATSQEAIDYANTLVTATSEIYRRDLGTVLTVPDGYLRLWDTTPPWGVVNGFDGLDPFVDWWNSAANPDVDLPRAGVHLFTNPVFGGVAYLPALCDLDFGYALSSVFGFFPYPIQHTDADNWDLFVTAHEWGHNHGSPHTFDYDDPPFDACTDGTGPDNGTIMSYCHLEPGGVGQVGMRFHPNVQAEMRSYIEGVACLDVLPIELGDYDFDGDRDAADLLELDAYLVQGFASAGAEETFDMNQDGATDFVDRAILDAIVNQPAPSATAYNGSGANPAVYAALSAPSMGSTWSAEIDASGIAGATSAVLIGYAAPDAGSVFSFGELLVDLTSTSQFSLGSAVVGGTASFSIPIAANPVFVGFTSFTQGVVLGTTPQLTNGLELFLNFE